MVGEVANWCLANGLTVDQADNIWHLSEYFPPSDTPSGFVRLMEQIAKEVG